MNSAPDNSISAFVSDKSVHKHTGKNWQEWQHILSQLGAQHWPYPEITKILKTKFRLTLWWQHQVAQGFEITIGRRIRGRSRTGKYSTTSTKSLPLSALKTWRLLQSSGGLLLWLKPFAPFKFKKGCQFESELGYFGEVRTHLQGRRVRLAWSESEWTKASILQISMIPRGADKCILVFQHNNLPDSRTQQTLRQHWQMALSAIRQAI